MKPYWMMPFWERWLYRFGFERIRRFVPSASLLEITIVEKGFLVEETNRHYPFQLAEEDTLQISDGSGKLFLIELKKLTNTEICVGVAVQ